MSQHLISLTLSDNDLRDIDAALKTLEDRFAGFLVLTPEERRTILKMGDKTEAFCRQTLTVATAHAGYSAQSGYCRSASGFVDAR